MRKVYIAGNWKMNKTIDETLDFIIRLKQALDGVSFERVIPIIFPPAIYLSTCYELLKGTGIHIGIQDVSLHQFGAYTGEVSAPMLASMDIRYSLAGHSERREYHNETDKDVNAKALSLLNNHITPVICVGEKEEERTSGITNDVILRQLNEGLSGIEAHHEFIIAYEPVWAIGTGKTATPEMAQEVHQFIRDSLQTKYGKEKSDNVSILYGGSIKENNFTALMAEKDIDGGLIGGASLEIESYLKLFQIGLNAAGEK